MALETDCIWTPQMGLASDDANDSVLMACTVEVIEYAKTLTRCAATELTMVLLVELLPIVLRYVLWRSFKTVRTASPCAAVVGRVMVPIKPTPEESWIFAWVCNTVELCWTLASSSPMVEFFTVAKKSAALDRTTTAPPTDDTLTVVEYPATVTLRSAADDCMARTVKVDPATGRTSTAPASEDTATMVLKPTCRTMRPCPVLAGSVSVESDTPELLTGRVLTNPSTLDTCAGVEPPATVTFRSAAVL